VCASRRADHDLAQLADFRVNAVINFCHMNLPCSILKFELFSEITFRKFIPPRRQGRKVKLLISPNLGSFASLRESLVPKGFMN
jgi:hypothetical protein